MSEHTPGPWVLAQGYDGSGPWDRLTVETADRKWVLCIVNSSKPECGANACLISAAPDMLAALQAVMGEWRDGYGLNCVQQVRDAIAKAKVQP